MSIADKLVEIAENVPKVHEAGFDKGKVVGLEEGYNEGYTEGFEAGEQSGDTFWSSYLQNGERTNYQYAFAGAGWNENTFRPTCNIFPTNAAYMFLNCGYKADLAQVLSDCGVELNFSRCGSYNGLFSGSAFTRLPTIVDTNSSHAFDLVKSCSNLVTVDEIRLMKPSISAPAANHYRTAFDGCEALKNIKFSGEYKITVNIGFKDSTLLTAESIVSIVEHLNETTSGMTVTFNQTAIDNADWSTTAYASWEALKATKTNWTFTNEKGTVI